MKQLITILISVLLTFASCKGLRNEDKVLKLNDFEFESIFGSTTSDPKSTYCLLGTGIFRTPRSDISDSLISDWIKTHPKATVIPVSSIGPIEIKDPDSKMVYCWIVEKQDTLNNYLIRNGCFPGGTMIRPKTWDEMEKWEKEFYEDSDEKMDVKVLIDNEVYDDFIEQIKSAELYAKDKKLGIWEKETEE